MPYVVRATPVADRQIASLHGARRKAFDDFARLLVHGGCTALGYRLTGDAPLSQWCVKHLRGADRAVVAFSRGGLADDAAGQPDGPAPQGAGPSGS